MFHFIQRNEAYWYVSHTKKLHVMELLLHVTDLFFKQETANKPGLFPALAARATTFYVSILSVLQSLG